MNLSHVHLARYTIRHGREGVRVLPYSVSNLSIQNRLRGYISVMCVDGEKSIGIRAQGVRDVVAFVVDSGNLENEGAWVGDGARKYRTKQPSCFFFQPSRSHWLRWTNRWNIQCKIFNSYIKEERKSDWNITWVEAKDIGYCGFVSKF